MALTLADLDAPLVLGFLDHLQSPEFLYRFDRDGAGDTGGAVSDEGAALGSPFVLASRLSFLVWGSAPDAELLSVAEAERLSTAADVEVEARRLLADDRARRGMAHFFTQWLDLVDFEEVEKDRRLFPTWDERLRADLASETRRFVEAVLFEDDARFETLLGARYTFTNARLEDFYGLPVPDPGAESLSRTVFGANVPRAGILTRGAVLASLAKADQTSPVHRGKFVREQFFCTVPPPPPPNVVVAPPTLDPRRTTRERFEQHRLDPACANCHELLDPVGLAFEHYDAVGRYRDSEAGASVDASGYLVGTDVDGPLDGVPELSQKLIESREVRRCVVTQLYRYAFGRGETDSDACAIDELEASFSQSGDDLRELVVAMTQTDAFLQSATVLAEDEEAP